MRSLYLLAFVLVCSLQSQAQGKKLRYEAELNQLSDMEQGWLLVPVTKVSSTMDGSNTAALTQRLESESFERAFGAFGFAHVAFFNAADSLQLESGLMDLQVWTAAGQTPEAWPPPTEQVFVLERKAAGRSTGADVVIQNSIVQKREARADTLRAEAIRRRARRADRIRTGLRTERDTWGHDKVVRMSRRLKVLTEGADTTAFQFTYSNFDPVNRDAAGWMVHRYAPTIIRKHDDLQYTFDFHYFVKVHYQTESDQRYVIAVAFLEERLQNRLAFLREKY